MGRHAAQTSGLNATEVSADPRPDSRRFSPIPAFSPVVFDPARARATTRRSTFHPVISPEEARRRVAARAEAVREIPTAEIAPVGVPRRAAKAKPSERLIELSAARPVPARLPHVAPPVEVPASRRRPRVARERRWPVIARVSAASVATMAMLTVGLPAYAVDPADVAVISPTMVVTLNAAASAAQNYTATSTSGSDLTRSDVTLGEDAHPADDDVTLTTACTVDGSEVSSEVAFPMPNYSFHMTSGVGYRYISALGYSDYHTGQDYSAPLGTSIFAIADGTVTEIGTTAGAWYIGVTSTLSTGETIVSYYVHEYANGVLVSEGDTVYAGEKIALVGQSGIATGPHLHLEIHDTSKGTPSPGNRTTMEDPAQWLEDHDAVAVAGC